MGDANDNPSVPALDENEQFISAENFLSADTASEWDALANRGNANVTDAMSKWERDSLYVKFDPLVAARKDPFQASQDPFVFKAPKPPGPVSGVNQPRLENINESNASILSEADSSYLSANPGSPNMNEGKGRGSLNSPKLNSTVNETETSFYITADEDDLNRTVLKAGESRRSRGSLENGRELAPPQDENPCNDVQQNEDQDETNENADTCPETEDKAKEAEEVFNGSLNDSLSACFSKMNLSNGKRDSFPVNLHEQSLDIKFDELMIQDDSIQRTPEKSILEQAPPSAVKSFPTTPLKHGTEVGEGDCERLDSQNAALIAHALSPGSIFGEEEADELHAEDVVHEEDAEKVCTAMEESERENSINNSRSSQPGHSSMSGSVIIPNSDCFDESSIHRLSTSISHYQPSPPTGSASNKQVKFSQSLTENKMSPGFNRSLPVSQSGEKVLSPRYEMNKSLSYDSSVRSKDISVNGSPPVLLKRNSLPQAKQSPNANNNKQVGQKTDSLNVTTAKSPRSPSKLAAETEPPNLDKTQIIRKSKKQLQNSAKLERIAHLKDSISQMTTKFEDHKKNKLKSWSKVEQDLMKNAEELRKQNERLERVTEEKKTASMERVEAGKDLQETEARFADMLMLYEKMKNATSLVERNLVILQKREEILTETLRKREARNQAIEDYAVEVLERMQRDFNERVKDKNAENMKLKAKIRMCEVTTSKLEGEIQQVDRESEKLRAFVNDFTQS